MSLSLSFSLSLFPFSLFPPISPPLPFSFSSLPLTPQVHDFSSLRTLDTFKTMGRYFGAQAHLLLGQDSRKRNPPFAFPLKGWGGLHVYDPY